MSGLQREASTPQGYGQGRDQCQSERPNLYEFKKSCSRRPLDAAIGGGMNVSAAPPGCHISPSDCTLILGTRSVYTAKCSCRGVPVRLQCRQDHVLVPVSYFRQLFPGAVVTRRHWWLAVTFKRGTTPCLGAVLQEACACATPFYVSPCRPFPEGNYWEFCAPIAPCIWIPLFSDCLPKHATGPRG